MQAEVEINKKKEEVKSGIDKEFVETEGKQKLLRNVMSNAVDTKKKELELEANNVKKDLQGKSKQ